MTKCSKELMKRDRHHPNGSHSKKEENPQEEDPRGLAEADQEDHQEARQEGQTEVTQTYPPTYDQFPEPMTRKQWGNSLMSLTGIEPRLSHSSTS